MLRYLLPLFLITTAFPQTLDGILDIEWLTNKSQVNLSMTKLESVELSAENDNVLAFIGGKFADNSVKLWSFHFYEDQFYHVDVILDTLSSQDAVIWSKTHSYLVENFGESNDYQKIDENQMAIYWIFYDGEEAESMIQLNRTIRGDLESRIQISYTYLPLYIMQEGLE